MGRRFLAIVALCLSSVGSAWAQWDVQFSDFTALKSFYNPAVSGTEGLLNVCASYSMQMAGYEGAPNTIYAGADLPVYFLSPRHGAGLNFISDKYGMFSTMRISLQYAYNFKIGKKGRLAIGVQPALMTETVDPSNVELEQPGDPAFPTSKVDGKTFDLGAGIYFTHPWVWAGLSAQHLLGPTITMGEKYEVSISQTFHLMAGCSIKLPRTHLKLQPAVLVQTDLKSWREDIQCKLAYEYDEKRFYAGIGYSPLTSTTFMLGGMFHGVKLGYSYQMYTSGIGVLNGAHEIVLGYQTELDLFKKGRNLHKSVRWL